MSVKPVVRALPHELRWMVVVQVCVSGVRLQEKKIYPRPSRSRPLYKQVPGAQLLQYRPFFINIIIVKNRDRYTGPGELSHLRKGAFYTKLSTIAPEIVVPPEISG